MIQANGPIWKCSVAVISRDSDNQITAPLHCTSFPSNANTVQRWNYMQIKCGNQRAKFNSVPKKLPFWKYSSSIVIDTLRLLIYRDIFSVFCLNFVNMLMKKMQWINNDKGKLIIISIWFPINSINQSIEIVSWNVNILKDESVRKGEV